MEKSKLVRDKIPQIIKNNGDKSVFHIASDEEYGSKLNEKLIEEVNEWSSSQTI
ncbi:TPA: nucleoside triphosphate pyrophosphohydrolase, partial [Candidatus Woesearchaeota archaeon]|nr:nucleoside triphosphate pyrophosphohydrolase [Candidatus Woesearchaeota archaeon]